MQRSTKRTTALALGLVMMLAVLGCAAEESSSEQSNGQDVGMSPGDAASDAEAEADTVDQDVDGGSTTPLDLSFCEDTLELESGTLCAVKPSDTDPDITDYMGTEQRPGTGYGFHVIGFPKEPIDERGVWVHFGGSFGRPYSHTDSEFVSRVWLGELMDEGYLAVQPAYGNESSVNGDYCHPSSGGDMLDNCAGDVRREILTGEDVSPQVDINQANSVQHRMVALRDYLAQQDIALSFNATGDAVDWSTLSVSGHSQGAGHAYYLAKNFGVLVACFLAGPFDRQDAVNPDPDIAIADWYLTDGSETPLDSMGAFVVESDDSYAIFRATYNFLGMETGQDWFETDGEYSNDEGEALNGHAAALAAPDLASFRARACFEAAAGL